MSSEGRIFYEKLAGTPADIKASYLLLSPTHAFSSVASAARAVILAGGTMSPFDDYIAHLFPTHPPHKITTLSCGHVIPPSNLFVWTLASIRPRPGPASGGAAPDAFEFSFQKRSDRAMIRQLGLALLSICSVVPDGVVVFFPSHAYLDEVVAAWQAAPDPPGHLQSGTASTATIWDRLAARKAVFRETRGAPSEELLQRYSEAILSPPASASAPAPAPAPDSASSQTAARDASKPGRGAVLLSVVGGRLSEGINFSDRLGRCVVVVGLPYPNAQSPEWRARTEYVEAAALARLLGPAPESDGASSLSSSAAATSGGTQQRGDEDPEERRGAREAAAREKARQAAREFYENACMRAVNQSIGRAIRHRGDYAAVVLVDRRFGAERIRGKLPGWIRGGMVEGSEGKGLQGLIGGLNSFFRGKQEGGG